MPLPPVLTFLSVYPSFSPTLICPALPSPALPSPALPCPALPSPALMGTRRVSLQAVRTIRMAVRRAQRLRALRVSVSPILPFASEDATTCGPPCFHRVCRSHSACPCARQVLEVATRERRAGETSGAFLQYLDTFFSKEPRAPK